MMRMSLFFLTLQGLRALLEAMAPGCLSLPRGRRKVTDGVYAYCPFKRPDALSNALIRFDRLVMKTNGIRESSWQPYTTDIMFAKYSI
jgi:hypothetical protein